MKQVPMYKGKSEVLVLPSRVERMKFLGWSEDKPKEKKQVKADKPKSAE